MTDIGGRGASTRYARTPGGNRIPFHERPQIGILRKPLELLLPQKKKRAKLLFPQKKKRAKWEPLTLEQILEMAKQQGAAGPRKQVETGVQDSEMMELLRRLSLPINRGQ